MKCPPIGMSDQNRCVRILRYLIASCSFVILLQISLLQSYQKANAGVGLNVNTELNHMVGNLLKYLLAREPKT